MGRYNYKPDLAEIEMLIIRETYKLNMDERASLAVEIGNLLARECEDAYMEGFEGELGQLKWDTVYEEGYQAGRADKEREIYYERHDD